MSERDSILVIGASGVVGRAIADRLRARWNVVGTHTTNRTPATVAFDQGVDTLRTLPVEPARWRAVILAGGITSLAACARDPVGTRRVNVEGSLRLAAAAIDGGGTPVFLSSDAVFRGAPASPVRPKGEGDATDPGTEYGRQKLAVESGLDPANALVLRLTKVADGFLPAVADELLASRAVRAASDQFFSLLGAADIATVVEHAIEANWRGLLHVAAPPVRSRLDWCRQIARAVGADPAQVQPCSVAEFDNPALGETLARDASLDGGRLAARLPFDLRGGDDLIASRWPRPPSSPSSSPGGA